MLPSTSVKSPRPRKPWLLDRRMGVHVAQSQQSLSGDQDQDFPLINIVQEQLYRRIPTTIFRVFVLLFPALLETRDDRHSRKRPSPQRAAQGDAMTSSTCRTFQMGPVVHTTLLSRGYPTVLRTVPWRNQQRVSTATDGSVFGFRGFR